MLLKGNSSNVSLCEKLLSLFHNINIIPTCKCTYKLEKVTDEPVYGREVGSNLFELGPNVKNLFFLRIQKLFSFLTFCSKIKIQRKKNSELK